MTNARAFKLATKEQVRFIGLLRRQVYGPYGEQADSLYYGVLRKWFDVESAKDLTMADASWLITALHGNRVPLPDHLAVTGKQLGRISYQLQELNYSTQVGLSYVCHHFLQDRPMRSLNNLTRADANLIIAGLDKFIEARMGKASTNQ